MATRITRSEWFKYLIETLTLIFVLGLAGGVILGLLRGWKYLSHGLYLVSLDFLKLSINESILIAFLLVVLYLFSLFVLERITKNTKVSCFVSGGLSCIPFFLFFGYRINKAGGINWSNLFTTDALIFNLKLGLGFVVIWLLVSAVLFLWTKSRILKTSPAGIRMAALFLGVIVIVNLIPPVVYRFHEPRSPNVVLILVDALRADHLSCYGYNRNTTPNIDKFSKDAVIFTQAISQSTFTRTSIASLFTSLYPYQHGVYKGEVDAAAVGDDAANPVTSDALSKEETTIAEALLKNGFLTTAWVQNAQLRSFLGFGQGFMEYDEPAGSIENINKKVVKWIDKMGRNHPFFAYIHYLDLHDPYIPKPPYDTLYGEYSDLYSRVNVRDSAEWTKFRRAIKFNHMKLERKDLDQLIAYYDGQLNYIDAQIGLLLEELKRSGLYDNSLIILTSDHGDGFMEHGFISHSTVPYDELLKVPLIIKFPDSLYGGKVVNNQVRLIDIMPTILDFLKLNIDSEVTGFSLLAYFDDNHDFDGKFPEYAYSEFVSAMTTATSVRSGKFKYINIQGKEDEFYDLSVDPQEKNNIIDVVSPAKVEEFRRVALDIAKKRKEKESTEVVIDKDTIEDLKALGYIQ
ncbi:MAG TPA: sulfatase [Thermodesulfobacteriota bacterium]|nr:sulfatase [Thermodesulfobacteriota bacterium]